jgi:hypothetical protein
MEEFQSSTSSTAEDYNPTNPFESSRNLNVPQDDEEEQPPPLLLTAPPSAMPPGTPPPSPTTTNVNASQNNGTSSAGGDDGIGTSDDASNAHTPPHKLPQFSPPPPPPPPVGLMSPSSSSLPPPPLLTIPSLSTMIPNTNTPMGYTTSQRQLLLKPPLHPSAGQEEEEETSPTTLLLESAPTTASNKDETTTTTKKKSKKKKKKKRKNKTYGEQYNAQPTRVQLPPPNNTSTTSTHGNGNGISYYNDSEEGVDPPSILNFCRPKKKQEMTTHGDRIPNHNEPPISTYTSKTIDGNIIHINTNTGSMLQGGPNTGFLNSSNGEGTTLPELMMKMRLLNLLHVAVTLFFLGFNILSKVFFLQADKIVLGAYLFFFTILLLSFEIVRGSPQVDTKLISSETNAIVKVVWGTVLQNPISRKVRYFLQSNFGILYSCKGRGLYLAFMGGVAIGQGWPMICLGISYIVFGIWTVTLGWRYPLLEDALVMDELEEEFGGKVKTLFDSGRSAVTWSSIHTGTGSGSYNGTGSTVGEEQSLLGSLR